MKKSNKNNFAKTVGSALATVQGIVDDVLVFGFNKLKEVDAGKVKPSDNETLDKVKYTAKKAAGFLGEIGENYFKTYEKIKAKKATKR